MGRQLCVPGQSGQGLTNMKTYEYAKKCNITTLKAELIAAGFDCHGCSFDGKITWVYLDDAELKSPAAVVTAHNYTDPGTAASQNKAAYASAANKTDFIAAYLGLK